MIWTKHYHLRVKVKKAKKMKTENLQKMSKVMKKNHKIQRRKKSKRRSQRPMHGFQVGNGSNKKRQTMMKARRIDSSKQRKSSGKCSTESVRETSTRCLHSSTKSCDRRWQRTSRQSLTTHVLTPSYSWHLQSLLSNRWISSYQSTACSSQQSIVYMELSSSPL